MGILRECARGQRVCSHSPAWDSAWTEGIGGSVDVCGWGSQRLRNVRNFSISQLFLILEWAMVASPRRTDQEMQREGEDRHRDKPGSSARLGNWRFNAKPPMVNCLKSVSPPKCFSTFCAQPPAKSCQWFQTCRSREYLSSQRTG